jgi:hypothetical protein
VYGYRDVLNHDEEGKVGIANVVPRTIAYRLLAPARSLADPLRIICRISNCA